MSAPTQTQLQAAYVSKEFTINGALFQNRLKAQSYWLHRFRLGSLSSDQKISKWFQLLPWRQFSFLEIKETTRCLSFVIRSVISSIG